MNREEYLRRNLIHASSVGALAGAEKSLARILTWKKRPRWLVDSLEGIKERAQVVAGEMAKHRDEVQ
jgi:hypothetical protein